MIKLLVTKKRKHIKNSNGEKTYKVNWISGYFENLE